MSRADFNAASRPIVDFLPTIFATHKPPLTVRQIYYQFASVGLVPLSKQGYRQVQRVLLKARELGTVPWEHFADRTRRRIQPPQWASVQDFADSVRCQYRKDYWRRQAHHVELWLEKDALAAFVEQVLEPYGTPLYVIRGFGSATFIHEAAVALAAIDKPRYIYYLGDHDPSGLAIEESLRKRFEDFGVPVTFKRLAVNLTDIEEFNLLPLEAKTTDSRCKAYKAAHGGQTVEIDALPPEALRRRIVEAVETHIDPVAWNRARTVEIVEQETINEVFDAMRQMAYERPS